MTTAPAHRTVPTLIPPSASGGAEDPAHLKIAMVAPPHFDIPPAGYGGIEAVLADLSDALVAAGHRVTPVAAGVNFSL